MFTTTLRNSAIPNGDSTDICFPIDEDDLIGGSFTDAGYICNYNEDFPPTFDGTNLEKLLAEASVSASDKMKKNAGQKM